MMRTSRNKLLRVARQIPRSFGAVVAGVTFVKVMLPTDFSALLSSSFGGFKRCSSSRFGMPSEPDWSYYSSMPFIRLAMKACETHL